MFDVAPCLTQMDQHGVAHPIGFNARQDPDTWHERTGPLDTCGNSQAVAQPIGMQPDMAVRRLTPVECERLQGFPDRYTEISWRGKDETPDSPRYKALGNSMAVPVMKWIGERIQLVEQSKSV
jgi:site-specific DNA-cytosine methylase